MVRLMHLADLHLGWEPPGLTRESRETRRRERDAILNRVVDCALRPQWRVQLVIVAGDLFETHDPSEQLTESAAAELARLTRAGIAVVTVPGNHDEISYHNSVYRRWGYQWPGHLVTEPMPDLTWREEIAGFPVHVYSLAYTGGVTDVQSLAPFPRSTDPGIHIGAFHGSLDWDAGERSLPLHSADLAVARYDYIALGHLHQYKATRVGDACAVYPGIIEPKHPADDASGCITLVDIAGEGLKIERPSLPVRRHQRETVDISTVQSSGEVVSLCRGVSDPEAVVEIELTGTAHFALDITAISQQLREDFFALSVVDSTDLVPSGVAAQYESDATVRGEFVRRLSRRLDEEEDPRKRRVLELALARGLAAFGGRNDG